MQNKINYFIRFTKTWDNISHAQDAKQDLDQLYPEMPNIEIGYHIPQPQYKSWVPNWLIHLILKSK